MNRNDALMERYEELRQGALGRQPAGTIWGLVVLRTKGMASWVRSWQHYGEGAVPCRLLQESTPRASPLSSTGEEVVRVLAGMVWALQKEGHDG
jgi:hypothetical protein